MGFTPLFTAPNFRTLRALFSLALTPGRDLAGQDEGGTQPGLGHGAGRGGRWTGWRSKCCSLEISQGWQRMMMINDGYWYFCMCFMWIYKIGIWLVDVYLLFFFLLTCYCFRFIRLCIYSLYARRRTYLCMYMFTFVHAERKWQEIGLWWWDDIDIFAQRNRDLVFAMLQTQTLSAKRHFDVTEGCSGLHVRENWNHRQMHLLHEQFSSPLPDHG